MLLHPLRQVRRDALSQQSAVQARAVVEEIRRVVVDSGIQTVVAHNNAVDHVQPTIDLAEVGDVVVVAYPLRHFLGGRAGEDVQVGVDDFHAGGLLSGWEVRLPASSANSPSRAKAWLTGPEPLPRSSIAASAPER